MVGCDAPTRSAILDCVHPLRLRSAMREVQFMHRSIGAPIFGLHRRPYVLSIYRGHNRYMSTIGSRIKQLRTALGLSVSELARRIDVKQPSLSDIESGETKSLKGETLARLCRELRVTPEYIMFGDGSPAEAGDMRFIAEAAGVLRGVPADRRPDVLMLVKSAVDLALRSHNIPQTDEFADAREDVTSDRETTKTHESEAAWKESVRAAQAAIQPVKTELGGTEYTDTEKRPKRSRRKVLK